MFYRLQQVKVFANFELRGLEHDWEMVRLFISSLPYSSTRVFPKIS